MHADLRDRNATLGAVAEIILLVFSVIGMATTFVGDDFYASLDVQPGAGRLALGMLGVLAFIGSLILLIVDPRGKSALHADAAAKWWPVVERFRGCRMQDGTWKQDELEDLANAYSRACELAEPIPDGHFMRLKCRYLRKVEISSLRDRYPSCPGFILRICIFIRDTMSAVRAF